MSREQVRELTKRLHEAQSGTTERVLRTASYEDLSAATPDGFTVNDTLRMWVWHFWSHHRELVRARGPLTDDNPHFHVPHYVRQAHEEFGRFIGELACLSDEYLDARPAEGGRTVREIIEHVLATMEGYFPEQVERARPIANAEEGGKRGE